MGALIVLNASQVLTLRGPMRPRCGPEMDDLGIVEDGAVLAVGGQIAAVGPRREVEAQTPPGAEVLDAEGGVVAPGFVDAHTHAVYGGDRLGDFEMRAGGATYAEVAAAGGGIRSTVRQTRAASEDELFGQGLKHAKWFLRNGTTTVEAKSGYGLDVQTELRQLRTIRRLSRDTPLQWVPTYLGAHAVPEEFEGRKPDYVRLVADEALPRVAAEGLAEYADIFCEKGYFDSSDARAVLGAAKRLGLGLRLHVDQLGDRGGARLAADLGAATADHLEHTGEPGIRALKEAGVIPVLVPGSVYGLGLGRYPAARAMLASGLPVVLATDFNPGSSPTPSMPMVLSLACTHMRMSPAEAFTASTINAAHSLGRGGATGSLEVGKRADLALFDARDYREVACYFGVEHAQATVCAGRVAYRRSV